MSCCKKDECCLMTLLCNNKGKVGTFYFTIPNNDQWGGAKIFRGVIESACCSYFVLSDPQTGMRYVLFYKYLNYVTFDEEINLANDCCK